MSEAPLTYVCVCVHSLSQTMEGRLSVLIDECGVSDDEQLGALIVRTPSLLHTPLGQIRSRAEWLVSSGVVESGSRPKERSTNIGAFLLRQPDYFQRPDSQMQGCVPMAALYRADQAEGGRSDLVRAVSTQPAD